MMYCFDIDNSTQLSLTCISVKNRPYYYFTIIQVFCFIGEDDEAKFITGLCSNKSRSE